MNEWVRCVIPLIACQEGWNFMLFAFELCVQGMMRSGALLLYYSESIKASLLPFHVPMLILDGPGAADPSHSWGMH